MDKLLINLFFKEYRRKLLSLLLLQPGEHFHVREIARLTNTVAGTANKELKRLAEAGVLNRSEQGNQLLYQANTRCEIYPELSSMLQKMTGIGDQLSTALRPFIEKIEQAFIYGKALDSSQKDTAVDVCIIGEVSFGEVFPVMFELQQQIGREIKAQCFTQEQWQQLNAYDNAFIAQLAKQPQQSII